MESRQSPGRRPAPPSSSLRSRAARRPDQAIYVPPRGARRCLQLSPQGSPAPSPAPDSVRAAASASPPPRSRPDAAEPGTPSPVAGRDAAAAVGHGPPDEQRDDGPALQPRDADPPWTPAWDQTLSYFMTLAVSDPVEEEDLGEDSPVLKASETLAENSEDERDFSQEITAHLKEADVSIEHAHNDYSCFENVLINQEDFPHVIEIYDFPSMFKTDDLMDAFAEYSNGGMKIKWVDNTHALGVFSSESAALHALSIRHPLLKTRTLSDGSKRAKGKAVRRAEFIQPVKERPRTDSAVARRMVTRALGLGRGAARGQRY